MFLDMFNVQNRGATLRSWTALCSKKNKVATPLGTDPTSVGFDGAQLAARIAPSTGRREKAN